MSCQHYTSLKNIYVLLRIGPQERSECYAIDLNGAAQRPPATQDPGAVQTAVWRIFGRVSLQHKHVDKHILCVYTCSLSNCSQFNLWLSCGIRLPSLSSMANLTDFKDELIETVTYQWIVCAHMCGLNRHQLTLLPLYMWGRCYEACESTGESCDIWDEEALKVSWSMALEP